ncbi:hypothetical protein F2Q70_00039469 [Brassica cretica]|uniref:Uncharacterized protein n=1 Tax=Brassica cretica TaxID=69181 RepID=A0A8S9K9J5_BRACR|nr:hypothetical protein F2Q70_00039469 [Brassica cretica]
MLLFVAEDELVPIGLSFSQVRAGYGKLVLANFGEEGEVMSTSRIIMLRSFHHFHLVLRNRGSPKSQVNQQLRDRLTLINTGKAFSGCSREKLQASNEMRSKWLSLRRRQVLSLAENHSSKLNFLWQRCNDIPLLILKLLAERLRRDKYDEMKRSLYDSCVLVSSNFQQG